MLILYLLCNKRWPIICPIDIRHEELKIERIDDRIKRLAEGVWHKLEEEDCIPHRNIKNSDTTPAQLVPFNV